MFELTQKVLRTTASGTPLEWVNYQDAVRFYCTGQIAYTHGNILYTIHGGTNAITKKQSIVKVYTIVATYDNAPKQHLRYVPPLNNTTLFRRDAFICMYCGNHFSRRKLSRDHIIPLSLGGKDDWKNVVTACYRCNNRKAGRTPEKSRMQLLAIPFIPTRAEYVYLQSHNILADQMEFLKKHFPKNSRLNDHKN